MKTVLLSFDIEEFDMPLEYGRSISFDQQIVVSEAGTRIILDILLENRIPATFFSTVVFASSAVNLIKRIQQEGHELASHGYFHSSFKPQDLQASRLALEKISGASVRGFRMPRMMPVDNEALQKAGYLYDSSLNPIYLPGRYNNFFKPRTHFDAGGIVKLPASATPMLRIPLFWLSFHNFPMWLYKAACAYTVNRDLYLNIYFHPWEFMDLKDREYGLPFFVSKNSGSQMIDRFCNLVAWMKKQEYSFSTIGKFISTQG